MNLEEIKQKKLQEIQAQQLNEQIQFQQQIEVLENTAKQKLTKEAIERYGNIKSAHPELALQVVAFIAQQNIKEKITDEQFKEFLRHIQKPKRETKIIRK